VSVLPNLIAIIVQPPWRSEVRGLVTFAICIIAGASISYLQGDCKDVTDTRSAIVAVLITSQGIAPAIE
jgi:hypothetical protein